MIKTCMFDMGGVIDQFSSRTMEKQLLTFFGQNNCDTFLEASPLLKEPLHDLLCGVITIDQFWNCFQKLTNITLSSTVGLYTKFFNPKKNIETLTIINELKNQGMRVIAATNVEPPHRKWHEEHKDYDLFDCVYTSDVLHLAKPDPLFFLAIMEQENKAPDTVFFVDDNKDNIITAQKLGFHTHLFTNAKLLKASLVREGILQQSNVI